jgi:hypothetical protein
MQPFEMVKDDRRVAGFGVMLVGTPSLDNRLTLEARGEPNHVHCPTLINKVSAAVSPKLSWSCSSLA